MGDSWSSCFTKWSQVEPHQQISLKMHKKSMSFLLCLWCFFCESEMIIWDIYGRLISFLFPHKKKAKSFIWLFLCNLIFCTLIFFQTIYLFFNAISSLFTLTMYSFKFIYGQTKLSWGFWWFPFFYSTRIQAQSGFFDKFLYDNINRWNGILEGFYVMPSGGKKFIGKIQN